MPLKDPEARAAYKREHYQRNREKLLQKAREYREENPEKVAAAKKRCYDRNSTDPAWRAERNERQKAARRADPDRFKAAELASRTKRRAAIAEYQKRHASTPRRKAREAVNTAVRYGKIPRASSLKCADCSNDAREYHHESYEPECWLDVVPLCAFCHKARHST